VGSNNDYVIVFPRFVLRLSPPRIRVNEVRMEACERLVKEWISEEKQEGINGLVGGDLFFFEGYGGDADIPS